MKNQGPRAILLNISGYFSLNEVFNFYISYLIVTTR